MSTGEERIRALVETFSERLSKVRGDPTPEQVHKLRVSTRRYTAAVEYGARKIRKKQQAYLDDLEQLRRRAGKVRDLDIELALLQEMNGDAHTDTELEGLREFVARKRQRRAQNLAAQAVRLRKNRMLDHMKQIGETALSDGNFDDSAPLLEAKARLAKLADKNGRHTNPKPRRLHKLRIELKMIRYLAELASASAEQESLLNELKGIQEALGKWHDWESLMLTAEKFFTDQPNSFVPEQIRSLAESYRMEAVGAVSAFFAGLYPSRKLPQRAKQPRSIAVSA